MPNVPFDLDDVTNLVQRDGISARLSEQEKRLLVLLAARAGTAFDKRALMDALWGQRAQWMEDAALVQLVSRLRRSLAPLGLHGAIVTVARVGYRFDTPATAFVATGDDSYVVDTASAANDGRTASAVQRCAATDGLVFGNVSPHPSITPLRRHDVVHGVVRDGHGEVCRDGVIVRIPQIEYRLLCALRSPADVVHDKRTLIAMLWPARPDQDDTNLMQVVSRLRRKLIPLGLHRHIVTVPRIGYRFEPCEDACPESCNSASPPPTSITPTSDTLPTLPTLWQRLRRLRQRYCATLPRALHTLTRHLRWRAR